jgi:transposase
VRGRPRRGRPRTGNVWLRTILVQSAQAAAHTKHPALAARSRRIAARRGHKKAVVALAHALLVIISHVIARRQPYHELGEDSFQRLNPAARAKRFVHHLTHLGFEVQLSAQQATASRSNGAASTLAGGS